MIKQWIKKALRQAGYDLMKVGLKSNLPVDFSDLEREIALEVKDYTLTPAERIVSLCRSVSYLHEHRIPGAFVECGVWRGGSMMAAALMLKSLGREDIDLYLFDTYEGMEKPTSKDVAYNGAQALGMWEKSKDWWKVSLEEVQKAMALTGYPQEKMHFIKGRVQDTLIHSAPASIALLRLDTDLYEPTLCEFQTLYPRLEVGGVVIVDDYGEWQGVRQATDEYLASTKTPLLLNRIDFSARIGVKVRESKPTC